MDPARYYGLQENGAEVAALDYGQISELKKGDLLEIAYAKASGVVLREPENGSFLEITDGLKVHPIDHIQQEKAAEGSTASLVTAASHAIILWEIEIDRLYQKLKAEYPDDLDAISDAEAAWHTFYTQHLRLNRLTNDKRGSIFSIESAVQRVGLVRDYARNLATWGRY